MVRTRFGAANATGIDTVSQCGQNRTTHIERLGELHGEIYKCGPELERVKGFDRERAVPTALAQQSQDNLPHPSSSSVHAALVVA